MPSAHSLTGVEGEVVSEHVLAEPNSCVGVEQTFVIVVSHSTTVLHLADHIAYGHPVHAL